MSPGQQGPLARIAGTSCWTAEIICTGRPCCCVALTQTRLVQLHQGVKAFGLGIYLPAHKALVLSDLHLGIEDALAKSGVLVPRQHYKELMRRVERIFAACDAEAGKRAGKGAGGGNGVSRITTIVLNGDLKHEFGRISDLEWREVKRFIDAMRKRGLDVVVVKGNHDVMLEPITRERQLKIVDAWKAGDILVVHGDGQIPAAGLRGIKTIIAGHEHPCVVLRSGPRAERYKCFVVSRHRTGPLSSCTLILQPSFGPLTMGIDVLRQPSQGPLAGGRGRNGLISSGEVFVVDEETDGVLDFGGIAALRKKQGE